VAAFWDIASTFRRTAVHALGRGPEEAAHGDRRQRQPGRELHAHGHHAVPHAAAATKDHSTPKEILILYEANYGLRHIYLDGRKLPPQGDPQPWWYGYSVGLWEGNTLVVETNNLRGAESGPYDGWLDVRGSPYSDQAKFTERFRRPTFGKLEIDVTLDGPEVVQQAVHPRINQRVMPDEELIEFICNENQQFRRRVKID
jgi:hypothetical protein